MNPLTVIRLAAEGIALIAIAFLWAEWRTTDADLTSLQNSEKAAAATHKIELKDASHAHDQELTDLRGWRATHDLGPVILRTTRLQTCPAPRDGQSIASGVGGDLHPGSDPVGPGGDTRDVGPVFAAIGAVLDDQIAALRQEQGVR